jgi:hypothetical protein
MPLAIRDRMKGYLVTDTFELLHVEDIDSPRFICNAFTFCHDCWLLIVAESV